MFLRVIFALSCLATQCLGRVNDDYDNPDPNKDCDEKIEKRVGRLSKYVSLYSAEKNGKET